MRDNGTLADRIGSLHVAYKREEVALRYAAIMRLALCRAASPFWSPKDR
jgi:hypothetical protein